MESPFILSLIRRGNRHLFQHNLLLLALLLAASGGLGFWSWKLFRPPVEIDPQELLIQGKSAKLLHRQVTIPTGAAKAAGTFEIDRKAVARILILPVGQAFLFIKVPLNYSKDTVTGWVEDLPGEMMNFVFDDEPRDLGGRLNGLFDFMNDKRPLIQRGEELAKRADAQMQRQRQRDLLNQYTLRVMVDGTIDTSQELYLILAAGAVLLAGFGLVARNFLCASRRAANPDCHPLVSQLEKLGPAETVARQIEDEVRSGDVDELAGVTLTASWLIMPGAYGADLIKLDDLVWLYRNITVRKSYGVTTGKDHSLFFFTSHGKKFEIGAAPEKLDLLAARIAARHPTVLLGFNGELEALWNAHKYTFADLVSNRRPRQAHAKVSTIVRCPKCNVPLTTTEAAIGSCPACNSPL